LIAFEGRGKLRKRMYIANNLTSVSEPEYCLKLKKFKL